MLPVWQNRHADLCEFLEMPPIQVITDFAAEAIVAGELEHRRVRAPARPIYFRHHTSFVTRTYPGCRRGSYGARSSDDGTHQGPTEAYTEAESGSRR